MSLAKVVVTASSTDPGPRIFLGVSNINTHAARTRTGTHEARH
jgi:hypothetical protein